MKPTILKTLTAILFFAITATAQSVWNGSANTSWYNTSQTEFTITTAEQLAGLAQLVNTGNTMSGKTIKLGADIMLNNTTGWENWGMTPPARNWTAIGNYYDLHQNNPFNGTFDGNGYVIRGVYINYINNANIYQGLFGYLGEGGIINNVGVVNSYIKGDYFVGGFLVGSNSGTVNNSYSTGTISGDSDVGGLVGSNSGTVNNSYSTGTISGGRNFVGGLVGSNSGTVNNSYSTGAVSGTDTSDYGLGGNSVGGLVGKNNDGTISNSYSTGTVSGINYIGGLVGNNYGSIKYGGIINSYSTGAVIGNDGVGGLVGSNSGTVNNSYSTGAVSGNDGVGGLVGYNNSTVINSYSTGAVIGINYIGGLVGQSYYGTVSNSYYDKTTSGRTDEGKGEGKETSYMQSSEFVALLNMGAVALFMNAWEHEQDKYPKLTKTSVTINIASYFASGEGTEADPYIITTKKHLENLSFLVNISVSFSGKYFKLGNDIALNDTTNWQEWNEITAPENSWTAIGNHYYNNSTFNGTFDGDNHIISGIYINNTSNYQGLFGYVSGGTIKNVGVSASYIKGNQYVGGLVGYNYSGTVSNSYSTGAVIGNDGVGGLVGYNGGTVSNSYSTGAVSGTNGVGGLVGLNDGEVINSYSTGTVSGINYIGGLVGQSYYGTVSNSYSTGAVSGTGNNVGGLVGYYNGTVSNSYYDKETSGQAGSGTGKTTEEMQSKSFTLLLNIEASNLSMNAWNYAEGSYPTLSKTPASEINIASYFVEGEGTEDSPYIITTKDELEYLSVFVNAGKSFNGEYFKLGNDIALNDTTGWQNWGTEAPGYSWKAIGTSSTNSFRGTFDGNGYVISGVYINATNNYHGLFGYVSNGTIKNVGVAASYIQGYQYVGGLVGYNSSGTVSNSYSTSIVSGRYVGGLVGQSYYGTVSNSYSTGTVSGTGNYVGGLVGSNSGAVNNSYSTGTVNGGSDVGGLVGYNGGTISNNYSTGAVSGTGNNVGGLVGYSYGTVSNSYYDKETSGQAGSGTGKTTAYMQSKSFTFILNIKANVLSMNAWVYEQGEYPKLSDTQSNAGINIAPYFASGYGTAANPYEIKTKEQLENFSVLVNVGENAFIGEYFKLGNDIALNDTTGWQNWGITAPEYSWAAIGTYSSSTSNKPFNGNFDGNGYVISGVYINNTSSYQGLFGYLGNGGTIKNVGVAASYIKGGDYVGGLVGYNYSAVSNSYSTGTVSGNSFVGGLMGVNSDGTVENSYSTSKVEGNKYVGGLVGYSFKSKVSNSYSTGTVNGGSDVGGLVGKNDDGTVSDSYYDKEISGRTDSGKGEGKTTAEMKTQSTYIDWDFEDTWTIVNLSNYEKVLNNGYPVLKGQIQNLTSLENAVVSSITQKTYIGSALEPDFTVTLNEAVLVKNTDYSVSYFNNTNAGTATITIAGMGEYLGAIETYFEIIPKPVSITGISATSKEYDGTVTATINGATLNGVVGNDAVSLANHTTGTFANKNVGAGKVVTTTMTLMGADAANYSIVQPALTADITAKPVTITGLSVESKEYDSNTNAIIFGTAKINGIIGADEVLLANYTTGTFANKNAGTKKAVTTAMSLIGIDAANYSIVQPTLTANITAKPVTIIGLLANNKVYNGNTVATVDGIATISGAITGDNLSVVNGTAAFANKNIGTDKIVAFAGFELGGTDVGNYTLTAQPANVTANISAKPVTITGLSVENKKYDGTTEATITGTATVSEVIDGDNVIVVNGTASFANKEVGTNKTVTFTGYSIVGADAGNYVLISQPASVKADITPIEDEPGSSSSEDEPSSSSSEPELSSSSELSDSSSSSEVGDSSSSSDEGESSSSAENGETPILLPQIATANNLVSTRNGLHLTATSRATVKLFNIKGILISSQNYANGVYNIPLAHLPKGMYIAKVSFGSESKVIRTIIR